MRIKLIFAWYDFWMGFYLDRDHRRLYFFPLPMFGVVIYFIKRYRAKFKIKHNMLLYYTYRINPKTDNDWNEGDVIAYNYALSSVVLKDRKGNITLHPMDKVYTQKFYIK